ALAVAGGAAPGRWRDCPGGGVRPVRLGGGGVCPAVPAGGGPGGSRGLEPLFVGGGGTDCPAAHPNRPAAVLQRPGYPNSGQAGDAAPAASAEKTAGGGLRLGKRL